MTTLIIISQLILSLSILVTLHELGHFLPARLFGMRVDKFYLFFDPWFAVWKTKKGETEYGLGWLPLGGYVKIAGMVDESMDTEQLAQPPQDWEFRSKPAWQRLIVMLGGVCVNFVLGFFIWAMILWGYGKEFLPMEKAPAGIVVDDMARSLGLQDGDYILKVGDEPYTKVHGGSLLKGIVIGSAKTITVRRDGAELTLNLPDSVVSKLPSYKGELVGARFAFVVEEAVEGNPAAKAGLQKGDSLVAVNGTPTTYYHEFVKVFQANKAKEITITAIRGSETKEFRLTTTENGTVGIRPRPLAMERQFYGFFESFPAGVSEGVNFLGVQLTAFGKMFSGEIKATESIGGFGSIASLFPSSWDWSRFWYITAVLSLILGFMNLLPIPALDGGHALFLIIEMIIRRPLPQKFMEYAQVVGILLLLGLMVFANGMDIYRWFTK